MAFPVECHEGCRAAGAHGAEHVPGVCGDQPQPGRRDLKLRRHVAADFRLVFELANRVDRDAPFEVLALEWGQWP